MGATEPYYWTMTLLFVDYVLLFFAFRRFDLLTVVTALFTFVVWGLCVAAAAAVAFQTKLRAAFGRMSTAVE